MTKKKIVEISFPDEIERLSREYEAEKKIEIFIKSRSYCTYKKCRKYKFKKDLNQMMQAWMKAHKRLLDFEICKEELVFWCQRFLENGKSEDVQGIGFEVYSAIIKHRLDFNKN